MHNETASTVDLHLDSSGGIVHYSNGQTVAIFESVTDSLLVHLAT
jgi:hypothetical protein